MGFRVPSDLPFQEHITAVTKCRNPEHNAIVLISSSENSLTLLSVNSDVNLHLTFIFYLLFIIN
jgi:hypothetical protein